MKKRNTTLFCRVYNKPIDCLNLDVNLFTLSTKSVFVCVCERKRLCVVWLWSKRDGRDKVETVVIRFKNVIMKHMRFGHREIQIRQWYHTTRNRMCTKSEWNWKMLLLPLFPYVTYTRLISVILCPARSPSRCFCLSPCALSACYAISTIRKCQSVRKIADIARIWINWISSPTQHRSNTDIQRVFACTS